MNIEYFFTEFCGILYLFRITRNPENNEQNFKGPSPPPLMQGERSSKYSTHMFSQRHFNLGRGYLYIRMYTEVVVCTYHINGPVYGINGPSWSWNTFSIAAFGRKFLLQPFTCPCTPFGVLHICTYVYKNFRFFYKIAQNVKKTKNIEKNIFQWNVQITTSFNLLFKVTKEGLKPKSLRV